MKGVLKFFFSRGRVILELILYKCHIDISYAVLTKRVSNQLIVFTATTGGAAGFTFSWLTTATGAALVAPPLLAITLFLRSVTQQMLHQVEYSKFKKMVNQILDNDNLKERLRLFFLEVKDPATKFSRIEMGPSDLDQNPALKHAWERLGICEDTPHSSGEFEEFIKEKIKEDFGLIKNPTETQLEEIIQGKVKRKPKGKTVYFRDFIKEIPDSDIIDTEIIEELIRVKSDNEL